MSDLGQISQAFEYTVQPDTVSLSATTTSSSVALSDPRAQQYMIYNAGTTLGFIAFDSSAVVATVPSGATPGSYPIPPGNTVLTVPANTPYAAVIMSSGTATVYITPGAGR